MAAVIKKEQLKGFIVRLKAELIQHNCWISDGIFSVMFKQLSKAYQIKGQTWKSFIQSYPEYFALEGNTVILRTALNICPEHCAQGGCSDLDCLNLHVCRFHFLSKCRFKGDACRFGHDLQSPHNTSALRYHLLDGLVDEQLGALLRLCRSEATLPRVCKFYGVGEKACTKGNKCQDLHICKFFLLGTCTFGSKCKKSHNFGDQQTVNILTNYGLHDHPEAEVKKLLCTVLQERQPKKDTRDTGAAAANRPEMMLKGKQLPYASDTKRVAGKQNLDSRNVDDQEDDKKKKASSICVYALVKQCKFGEKCLKVHSSNPYQWQYERLEGEWVNVPDQANDHLQKEYVVPSKVDCRDCPLGIEIDGKAANVWVNFTSMRMVADGKPFSKVRLVTTPSSVRSISRFATEWAWFWKDEHGKWNEYGIIRNGLDNADISSKQIEDAYAESTPLLSFTTQRFEYEIVLLQMVQRNLIEGTERPVCRRPKLPVVGGLMVGGPMVAGTTASNSYVDHFPAHWDRTLVGNGTYNSVKVDRGSPEWITLGDMFAKTMPHDRVRKVIRIQNEELWEAFSCKKKWMQNSLENVNEKLLFHGTRQEYTDAISQQGFDWRISGSSVGTKFGKGSYFARDASYSKNYTDSRQMFVVRVLVGDSAQGHPTYVKPPLKSALLGGKAYNSCVNNPSDPSIYVIFEHAQTYPEYLITY